MKKVLLVFIGILLLLVAWYGFKTYQSSEPQDDGSQIVPSIVRIDLTGVRYSYDFSGADRIVVQYEDYSSGSREELDEREITDPKVIARVIQLLKELPKQGDVKRDVSPGLQTELVAYQGERAVSFVRFYRTMLQAEDTAFYESTDMRVGQLESALYSIVAELRQR